MINYHQLIFVLIFPINPLQSPQIIFKIIQYLQDIFVCCGSKKIQEDLVIFKKIW